MKTRVFSGVMVVSAALASASACSTADDTKAPAAAASSGPHRADYPPLEPADAALPRLTRAQYDNAIVDLLGEGVALPPTLEPDANANGLLTVGATIVSLSPRGVELYEDAARSLGEQLSTDKTRQKNWVPCTPSGKTDSACMKTFVETFGRRVFRRPLTADELNTFAGIGNTAAETLGDFWKGVSWAATGLLQSPYFLYRVESSSGAVGGYEMASRLSFFLWNSIPDDELLDAADKGDLEVDSGIEQQAKRMLADPKAHRAVRNFYTEWLSLSDLDQLNKDPNIFKHFSADLGATAREETLLLAEHLVFERDADLKDFFTSTTTFVNRRLAAIYDVPAPVEEGFGQVELPDTGQRRGFLGQVSFLALHSHPTSSSPTERGVFLRENILCDEIPSPPSNLNTAIPPPSPDAKTMRDRLIYHMQVPSCAGCHKLTDIVGLGFENFDGLGRFRSVDNGETIDASGDLDEEPFTDFKEFTQVVADSPKMTMCFVNKMYSYALAHPISGGEDGTVDYLHANFEYNGRRVQQLMLDIVMSDGFRTRGAVK